VTIVGSNLSSKVIAAVGIPELSTSSTPCDRSDDGRHPARAAASKVPESKTVRRV
jgi:hypothetical protein